MASSCSAWERKRAYIAPIPDGTNSIWSYGSARQRARPIPPAGAEKPEGGLVKTTVRRRAASMSPGGMKISSRSGRAEECGRESPEVCELTSEPEEAEGNGLGGSTTWTSLESRRMGVG
jgi:hypothetical protein